MYSTDTFKKLDSELSQYLSLTIVSYLSAAEIIKYILHKWCGFFDDDIPDEFKEQIELFFAINNFPYEVDSNEIYRFLPSQQLYNVISNMQVPNSVEDLAVADQDVPVFVHVKFLNNEYTCTQFTEECPDITNIIVYGFIETNGIGLCYNLIHVKDIKFYNSL